MTEPIRFTALCPQCEREIDQGTFPADVLREFLDEQTLRFYCPSCDAEWCPKEQELNSIASLLTPLIAV
jgi:hypothetical protein